MNINPIESINGDIIEFSKLPQNKRTILVPEGKKPEEKIIAKVYSRKLKIEINELNIEYYKDNQKFFIISSMATTKYPGYIKSPIVIIHNLNDNVTGAISTKELIFQAHTSDFNSEIMPYLQEYGIEFSTASSVSAGDDILEVLNQKLIEMLVVFTSNIFLILILFITIMYETWIYFENNRKLFVLKKIEGFSFINIHSCGVPVIPVHSPVVAETYRVTVFCLSLGSSSSFKQLANIVNTVNKMKRIPILVLIFFIILSLRLR